MNLAGNHVTDLVPLADLTNLTSLELSSNEVGDLTPLAGLTGLETLNLRYNQVTDLRPLAGLTGLTALDLISNNVSDVTPLANLTNLVNLSLSSNQISDITPLAHLTGLTYLDLSVNPISDITALSHLTGLTNLNLTYDRISDLTPLAGLTNLTDLHLGIALISDLTPLAGLTGLTNLSLGVNQISDLTPLAGLTNLADLTLSYNRISDLTPLTGLHANVAVIDQTVNLLAQTVGTYPIPIRHRTDTTANLVFTVTSGDATISPDGATITYHSPGTVTFTWAEDYPQYYVNFSGTATVKVLPSEADNVVPDPAFRACLNSRLGQPADAYIAASQLAELWYAYCSPAGSEADTGITSLEGAQYLTRALSFSIDRSNALTSLAPLANLTQLSSLGLSQTSVTDLTPLSNLTALQQLDLRSSPIADLTPLTNLTNLPSLTLDDNQITDITPLAHLTNLGDLQISNNHVTDLTPLTNLTNLYYLNFSNNEIADIAPLADMTSLLFVYLNGNRITDLTALAEVTGLVSLNLNDNQITDLSPLSGLTSLSNLQARDQQAALSIPEVGTYPVPVTHRADTDHELRLTVQSGDATLNADGTITYSSPGLTTLVWEDGKTAINYDGTEYYDVTFSGTLTVTVLPLALVQIPDPAFLACVDANLGLPNGTLPTTIQAAALTHLTCTGTTPGSGNIRNLEGLQAFTGLDSISIATAGPVRGRPLGQLVATTPCVSGDIAFGPTTLQPATIGQPVAYPSPTQAFNPGDWPLYSQAGSGTSLQSGNATLDTTNWTVTYNTVGTFVWDWWASVWITSEDLPQQGGNRTCEILTNGTFTVPVTPAPSLPDSDSDIDATHTSSTTGGLARAADGHDPYTLTVTIHDANNQPITGLANRLTTLTNGDSTATISDFTDNNDGTYTAHITSTSPQTLTITVQLDGQTLGTHQAQFIGITIEHPTRHPGEQQTITGLNFQPGETVHGTLNSDPIDLGTVIAAANGSATFITTLPANFPTGHHTVTLVGQISGTQTIGFQVTAAGTTPGDTPTTIVPTGANPAALALAALAAFFLIGGGTMLTARERLRLN